MHTTSTGYSVAARMNRLPVTRQHRIAASVIGIAFFFEGYEAFLPGFLAHTLVKEFSLSSTELTLFLSAGFAGMFLGAFVFGHLADRVGRHRAFALALLLYGLMSIVAAFAPSPEILIAARFLTGVPFGAAPSIADTYISELLPAKRRGRYLTGVITSSFVSVPFGGFLAMWLLPLSPVGLSGWRWMFLLGATGALAVYPMMRMVPESPRWLEMVSRQQEAEEITGSFEQEARRLGHQLHQPEETTVVKAPHRSVLSLLRPPYRRRTLMMAFFYLLQPLGKDGFAILVPLMLVAKGFSEHNSLLYSGLSFVGYPLGSILAMPIIERFERKYLVLATTVALAACIVGFGVSTSPVIAVTFGIGSTFVANLFAATYHVYQAEIFPTHLRSTATGWTFGLSRISAAAIPFVMVPLIASAGDRPATVIIAGAMVLIGVVVAVVGPRSTGHALESVNEAQEDARGSLPSADESSSPSKVFTEDTSAASG